MQQYGVLIADDSSFMRRCISMIIEQDPQFFIIGIARNGQDALEKVHRLKPDIVTMDVEMPEMDGIEALQCIMKECPVPVVMLSNYTEEGAKTTIKALELGAVDFFLKSSLVGEDVDKQIIKQFLDSLKTFVERAKLPATEKLQQTRTTIAPTYRLEPETELLVIGCSTGGPSALQSLLPRFQRDIKIPILVIQHMPPGFTGPLAERFNTICQLKVKEAEEGDVLTPGTIYIAPAGYQTYLKRKSDHSVVVSIEDNSPIETLYKPSVSVSLLSAVQVYKNKLVTVILTGMGNDGLVGCEEVKRNKGRVIVEAEESCIVYGMPKVVQEAGLADYQVPLSQMFQQIIQCI